MNAPTRPRSLLRIGEIAKLSGVSAKALRLYLRRGLIAPSAHATSGYRLYDATTLQRLMHIVLLKRGGFSLAQIAELLAATTPLTPRLIAARIAALKRELSVKTDALTTLQTISERLSGATNLSLDQLLESIHMSNQADLRVTDEQRQALYERVELFRAVAPEKFATLREQLDQELETRGAAELEAAQRRWRELSADIRAAMAAGTPATAPELEDLTQRWQAFVARAQASSGHANFLDKMRELYREYPQLATEQSMSPALIDYMEAAVAARA